MQPGSFEPAEKRDAQKVKQTNKVSHQIAAKNQEPNCRSSKIFTRICDNMSTWSLRRVLWMRSCIREVTCLYVAKRRVSILFGSQVISW